MVLCAAQLVGQGVPASSRLVLVRPFLSANGGSVYFAECGMRNFDHVYFAEILMRNVPQIIRCSNSAFRKILFNDMQCKMRSS